MSDLRAVYECPLIGCARKFQTIKFMIDHMVLYHDGPGNNHFFTCGIDDCRTLSSSVHGYRLHVSRKHSELWQQSRYQRRAEAVHLSEVPSTCVQNVSYEDNLENDESVSHMTATRAYVDHNTQLQKKISQIVLKQREINLMSQSAMENFVTDISDIVKYSQMCFMQSLSQVSDISENVLNDCLKRSEAVIDDIFQTVCSNKRLKSYCKKYMGMIPPTEIVLDRYIRNGKSLKNSYQYVSVLSTLRNFLEHDDVASEIVKDAENSITHDILYSYKDGSACKGHSLFSTDGLILRLHFYIDDFEVCNPIGSRRSIHKLTAVYFLVGNIHTKYWSQNSSIHLALLARSKLVKAHGLQKIMTPLLSDIKVLETKGITVNFCGSSTVFRGSIATISADNLASHEIGGFRQSFSSGKICRHCLADYDNLSHYVSEESCH